MNSYPHTHDSAFRVLVCLMLLLGLLAVPQAAYADDDLAQVGGPSGVACDAPQDEYEPDEAVVETGGIEEGQAGELEDGDVVAQQPDAYPEEPEGDALTYADDDSPAVPDAQQDESDSLDTMNSLPAAPEGSVAVSEGTYVFQSSLAPDKIIDAAGVNPQAGAAIDSWQYNGGDNQKWMVEHAADTEQPWYRLLLKKNTSLALTADEKGGVSVAASSDSELADLWAFLAKGDDTVKLVSALTNKVLDISWASTKNGASITQWQNKSADDANQRFAMVEVGQEVAASDDPVGEEGVNALELKGTGLVADIDHASQQNGANALLWTVNKGINQTMYLEPDGKGYYLVWNACSGKVLDVDNANILPGTNVLQWQHNGQDNQKWAVYQAADGTITLRNKATGLWLGSKGTSLGASLVGVAKPSSFSLREAELLNAGIKEIHPFRNGGTSLDVREASASSGADVLLWFDTDALNQRFELVSAGNNLWRVRTASSGGWLTDNGKGKAVTQQGSSATKDSAEIWRATFKGGWFGLICERTGRALDMFGGGNGANTIISTWDPHGGDAQHFSFVDTNLVSTGIYFFQNAGGKYLDIDHNSLANGGNVITWERNDSYGEYFAVEHGYGLNVRLKNAWSEKYLTATGTADLANVIQQDGNTSNLQQWRAVIADGGYVSFINVASGKALDVYGASTGNGANVEVYAAHQGNAQKWKPVNTGYELATGYLFRAARTAYASHSSTGYLIVVDRDNTKTIVFSGGNGNWKVLKHFDCSVGAPGSPTVTGNFTVGDRGYSFGHGYTCYYWTQIYSDYLFHSVKYYEGTRSIMDGRLNAHISAGCVRMDINNAYWIYSTIPSGTRIVIY